MFQRICYLNPSKPLLPISNNVTAPIPTEHNSRNDRRPCNAQIKDELSINALHVSMANIGFETPTLCFSHSSAPISSHLGGLNTVIRKPVLCQLFRAFLDKTHCSENLAFYQEATEFIIWYDQTNQIPQRLDRNHDAIKALNRTYTVIP